MAAKKFAIPNLLKEPFSLSTAILLLHGLPFILFGVFAAWWQQEGSSWKILTLGLFLSCIGSLVLLTFLRLREENFLKERGKSLNGAANLAEEKEADNFSFDEDAFATDDDERSHRIDELNESEDDLGKLSDLAQLQHRFQHLSEQSREKDKQLNHLKEMKQQLLKQLEKEQLAQTQAKESFELKSQGDEQHIQELEAQVEELKESLEKKLQLIAKLENKVHDLNYEVKTLLQIGEMQEKEEEEPVAKTSPQADLFLAAKEGERPELSLPYDQLPPSFDKKGLSPYDASLQLEKCIQTAKRLTGANHLGGKRSRFLDLALDSNVIDLRRLFDSFRNENSTAIIVYAPKDERLLFANHIVRDLLGWSPERFSKDFFSLIQDGAEQWKLAIKKMQPSDEAKVDLLLKTKAGDPLKVRCHLGIIPSGVFVNHVIGIVLPL